MIVNALPMIFFGSRYVVLTFSALLFFAGLGVSSGLMINLGIVKSTSETQIVVAVFALCLAIAIACAWFGAKFADKWSTVVLAVWVGVVLVIILCSAASIKDNTAKAVLCTLGGLAGWKFGQSNKKYIKSIGTALIGSFMLAYGIAQEVGGFPPIFETAGTIEIDGVNTELDDEQIETLSVTAAYLGGILFFTCLGGFVQLKYITADDEDEDDMMNKDFA